MANQNQNYPIVKVNLPGSSGIPRERELERVAQVTLPAQQGPSQREIHIANRTKETIMIQLATAGITEHGQKLIQNIVMNGMQHFDEVSAFDQSIRTIARDPEHQANTLAFNRAMLQIYTNSSVEASALGIAKILDTIRHVDLTPPDDAEPQMIVEDEPGFFGQLFGHRKVTKVLR